jgi:hypothetical protein
MDDVDTFKLVRIGSAGSRAVSNPSKGVDVGLFAQRAAEYMKERHIPLQWNPPPGFVPLSGGDSSNTFLSNDGKVVYKCYSDAREAKHEWQMVRRVMALAPEYTAGPAHLYLAKGGQVAKSSFYYIMSTRYAGEMLEERLERLTPDEHALGLLQAIHFTLLLGEDVLVDDIHRINMCVSKAGSAIEIRWIDFVKWTVPTGEEEKAACMHISAKWLLDTSNWESEDLWSDRTCSLVNANTRCLQSYEIMTASEICALLLELTKIVLARIKATDTMRRGSKLQDRIVKAAARVTLLREA